MENKIVLGGALQDAFSKYHAKNKEKYETIENSVLELDKKLEDMEMTGGSPIIENVVINEMSNPLTTKPLEYGYFKLSNDVSKLSANTSVPFDVVAGGNMELNQNGEVLLKAGKTYKILAGAFITCNDTKIAIGLRIVNAETKEFLIGGAKVPVTHTTAYSGNDIMGILTPEKDMYIGVQSVYDIALVNSVYTNLVVEEVRDNVVNQYGGFETEVLFDGEANSVGEIHLSDSIDNYDCVVVYGFTKPSHLTTNIDVISNTIFKDVIEIGNQYQFMYDATTASSSGTSSQIRRVRYHFKTNQIVNIDSVTLSTSEQDTNKIGIGKIIGIKGQIPSLLVGGKF